jgi:hypothetical protein
MEFKEPSPGSNLPLALGLFGLHGSTVLFNLAESKLLPPTMPLLLEVKIAKKLRDTSIARMSDFNSKLAAVLPPSLMHLPGFW